jgi:hypothetical protein
MFKKRKIETRNLHFAMFFQGQNTVNKTATAIAVAVLFYYISPKITGTLL